MRNTLDLCPSCLTRNRHLEGITVYVRRRKYSAKNTKTKIVRELYAQHLPSTEIARRAEISLRQVYRLTRGK